MGNAPRDFKEVLGSEDEDEVGGGGAAIGRTGTGGRKVRAEPGQGATQQVPVQTAAPTTTAMGHSAQVTEKPVVPGGTGVPVTTAAPTATAGAQPTPTTGAAAHTTTHAPTTTGA